MMARFPHLISEHSIHPNAEMSITEAHALGDRFDGYERLIVTPIGGIFRRDEAIVAGHISRLAMWSEPSATTPSEVCLTDSYKTSLRSTVNASDHTNGLRGSRRLNCPMLRSSPKRE